MVDVVLTGANGFVGWHTRAAARAWEFSTMRMALGVGFCLSEARRAMDEAERFVHLAGVNRGMDEEVEQGNVFLAGQAAEALRSCKSPPKVVVYADSVQAGNGTVYGEAKRKASNILRDAALSVGSEYVDLKLPNLFGEGGRAFYNSVTATFCQLLAEGKEPKVENDRELVFLHAQNAAELLLGVSPVSKLDELSEIESVSGLLGRLKALHRTYSGGTIPDLSKPFDRDLFNTLRSHMFDLQRRICLAPHLDARGSFCEIVRSEGGEMQNSFSTTMPGVTRGNHFHLRKVERFVVLAGSARIRLRRFLSDEILNLEVSGEMPVAIDMPTMWAHSLTNVGDDVLYTFFWANEMFRESAPDTIPEEVQCRGSR